VLETFHPPTYYLRPDAVALDWLEPVPGRSFCEWKVLAINFDSVRGKTAADSSELSGTTPSQTSGLSRPWAGWYCPLSSPDGTACWGGWRAGNDPSKGGFYGGWTQHRQRPVQAEDPLHPKLI